MIKKSAVSAIALSVAFAAAAMAFDLPLVTSARAQEGAAPAPAAGKKTVSIKLGPQFKEAQALLQQRKYKETIAKLDELKAAPGKTAYENYLIATLSYNAYTGLQQYADAAKAAEVMVESPETPASQKQPLHKGIVQNYFLAKNMAKFNEESAKYTKEYGADLDLQALQVQALFQANNYKAAADAGRALIKAADAKGVPEKEDWLKLVRFAEHEQGNTAGEQTALEALLQKFPSQQYWSDLLTMAQRSIKGGTKVQLELYRLMFATGTLTKAEDYVSMAELSLQANLPSEAKKIVDAGIQKKILAQGAQRDRHLRLQNMANTQADESAKALAAADTEAKAAATGDPEVHVGEIYWVSGQADKAIDAFQTGIKKGVKDKDEAELRLGVAYIGQNKRAPANEAFKAITPNTPWAQLSRLWTLYSTTKQS